jgi:hypothetical protein
MVALINAGPNKQDHGQDAFSFNSSTAADFDICRQDFSYGSVVRSKVS